jgi:hypothetical protein
MEQIMECLLSKMVCNQKEVKAHHEKMEGMISFGQQKMIANIKAGSPEGCQPKTDEGLPRTDRGLSGEEGGTSRRNRSHSRATGIP